MSRNSRFRLGVSITSAENEAFERGATRDASFDTIYASIRAAIAAHRTLGGLCGWLQAWPKAALISAGARMELAFGNRLRKRTIHHDA